MSEVYLQNGQPRGGPSDSSTEIPRPKIAVRTAAWKCNVALPGSTGNLTAEIGCILRHRLLIAAVITSAGFTIFFLRGLFTDNRFLGFGQWDLAVQGVCATVLVLVATLLASSVSLDVRRLRLIELILFGVIALYFAWVQLVMFQHGRILDWAVADQRGNFLRLANSGNILRWFGIIVIYGTFVPNTWKRCAIFTAIWAAIPLVLMTLMCFGCPIMGPYLLQSLLDMLVLLGIASAIAIFGSYKISELQQEAVQARKLGQYQLKQLLGRGGMGEVYLGEHMMLRRACAIKLIRPEQSGDATSLSRFEREVKAMATLTHWNTVEVFDYGLTPDGTFYYVMEYLPGLSLQEMVEQYGPLPPARAVHFLRQMCAALQEAHSIGLIHRDIKPSNVIACERGGVHDVAKLLDFGLVQSVGLSANTDDRLTIQGMVLGSPPYMSPEQAMGKEQVDTRADIYSIGGVAYFLLTGQAVFERDTPIQILMAHVYEPVTPLAEMRPEIPADLEEIILRCLSKNPRDRFPDAESLEQALAECSCADQWDRQQAAAWWRTQAHTPRRELAPSAAV